MQISNLRHNLHFTELARFSFVDYTPTIPRRQPRETPVHKDLSFSSIKILDINLKTDL